MKEQLSLLSHSHSKDRLGCTGFCHILKLRISSTACSALHFWLNERVERIGVHLGGTHVGLIDTVSLFTDSVFKSV